MLKTLIKKQLMEAFRGYFYNARKNTARSKSSIIRYFILYAVLTTGVIGGIFGFLAFSLCPGLHVVGMDWLYFTLLSGMSIIMGAFGSIFNTYAGLYLSKDNDLLLSMPIPESYIIASRLINVYILGTIYSATAIIPAIAIYWYVTGITFAKVICGILLTLIISIIVLILSCVLGWAVARISLKLKNKSFTKVFVSLILIGAYYFVYFKAQSFLSSIIANAEAIGSGIRTYASVLYAFGKIGAGDLLSTLIFTLISFVLLAAVWYVLKRSFIAIVTASGKTERVKYKARDVKTKSAFFAFFVKELGRFTSSPNYMLNCGFGVVMVPVVGIVLLIKGPGLSDALAKSFPEIQGAIPIIISAALITLMSSIDIAAPSVSLEGKNIWIAQSLPISSSKILLAKGLVQFSISIVPLLITYLCCIFVFKLPIYINIAILFVSVAYTVFAAIFGVYLSIKMPNLTWTNELYPIKQSSSVMLSLFGGWGVAAAFAVLYFLFANNIIGAFAYMCIWAVILLIASAILWKWIDKKGSIIFSNL